MLLVDVELKRGDFRLKAAFQAGQGVTALFGRSGAGKSTVLDIVAGLAKPDSGRVTLGDEVLFDSASGRDQPTHKRRIGMVFQDSLLFPHLSVRKNLLYGRRFTGDETLRFDDVVDILGIASLVERRPVSLSGGERQRVAIGRALLSNPRLLLMDEPLAALDAARKREILALVETVRDRFGVPILYVSHNVEEVARLAAHVVRLEAGRVFAAGSPTTVLADTSAHPGETRFETVSVLTGKVLSHDLTFSTTRVAHPAGEIAVPGLMGSVGGQARIVVRGTDIALAIAPPEGLSIRTALSGTVGDIVVDQGPIARIDLRLTGGDSLTAYVTREAVSTLGLVPGTVVFALIKAAAIES